MIGNGAQTSLPTNDKKYNLERRSSLSKSFGLIVIHLFIEVSKQVVNYAMVTSNNNQYPMPSPLLIFFSEIFKLFAVFSYVLFTTRSLPYLDLSFRFCVPAVCYFCTNYLYLLALKTVSPPLWIILVQTKTIYTAIIYKLVFGRSLTPQQMVGCLFIVLSIPTIKVAEMVTSSGTINLTFRVFIISQACALFATTAALSVELLLKNDRRSFTEQQIWLYIFGAIFAYASLLISVTGQELSHSFANLNSMNVLLVVASILFTGFGGLCVPQIMRNLDVIVKDYLAALNNIVLSVFIAVIFPAHFSLSPMFLLGLVTLMTGIVLYEKYAVRKTPSASASGALSDKEANIA